MAPEVLTIKNNSLALHTIGHISIAIRQCGSIGGLSVDLKMTISIDLESA